MAIIAENRRVKKRSDHLEKSTRPGPSPAVGREGNGDDFQARVSDFRFLKVEFLQRRSRMAQKIRAAIFTRRGYAQKKGTGTSRPGEFLGDSDKSLGASPLFGQSHPEDYSFEPRYSRGYRATNSLRSQPSPMPSKWPKTQSPLSERTVNSAPSLRAGRRPARNLCRSPCGRSFRP